jgi:hypothetical protein
MRVEISRNAPRIGFRNSRRGHRRMRREGLRGNDPVHEIVGGVAGNAADVDSFANILHKATDLSIGAGNAWDGMAAAASVPTHNGQRARHIAMGQVACDLRALILCARRSMATRVSG